MPKILELEQHVADLIVAGEVVQRPSSVVKELMENSIDSGASIVTVEIASGGMTYIRVTDNGCGIAAEDVKTAFLRHATSKLRDAHGLEAIGTLGFRGEALAAIAAVSRVELMTREPGANEGTSLTLEAGVVVNMSPVGSPEGTTIIVRDLFFNTPARLKFMKTDRAESSGVASVVLKCALSRPDISFRFIKDGKTEYHTPGDSRVDSCIYSLLGREIEAGLVSAESSDEAVSVSGFVSTPAAARGNRSYQFFFVNGRVIRSLLLQSALEQAYKNTLPSGRYPSCVLFITTKPGNVDVNVHPAKTEVKFVSEKQIFDGVYYAALGAIDKAQLNSTNSIQAESDSVTLYGSDKNRESGNYNILNTEAQGRTGGYTERRAVRETAGHGGFKTMQADEFLGTYVSEPIKEYPYSNKLSSTPSQFSGSDIPYNTPQNKEDENFTSGSDKDFRLIGEALNVYIIIEYENSIWLIDKHAAHERIHFDALRNGKYETMSESLISPVVCRLGHEDTSLLLDNAGFLETLGFSVESFGEDSVAVRHIPSEIDVGDTESVLSEMCQQLRHGGVALPSQRDGLFKSIACKAAIKAGRASGHRELEALAARVVSGEVSHCPHGRPVAFEITKATLDKGFGRI